MVILHEQGFRKDKTSKIRLKWMPPDTGTMKLNVDGVFGQDGAAGAGMVLRDHMGQSIFAACHQL
jgi:hypothetical protein